jgi:hypothetical protein
VLLRAACRTASLSERIAGAQIILVAKVTGFVPLHQVTFSSKEVFKGRPGTVLTVPTGVSDCDLFLPPIKPRTGDEYLLYVGQSGNRLYASRCQNSGLVADRAVELAKLRKWIRSNPQSDAR